MNTNQPPEPEPETMNDHPVLAAILDQTPPGVPHDRPLPLNPDWDFTSAGRLSSWENMGAPNLDHIELRGIFWRHEQTGPVTIGIRNASYWSYTNAYGWDKEFDATPQGAYMGTVGTIDNPYVNGKGEFVAATDLSGESVIQWNPGRSRGIHWWAGERHPIHTDQRAELAVAEVYVAGSDPILAAIGTDYYDSPSMNSTRAPGAGIARHIEVPAGRWVTLAWLTVPEIDADDVSATTLRAWVEAHPLPDVGISGGSDVVIIEPEPEPPTPDPEPTGDMIRMDVYAHGTTGQEIITVNGTSTQLSTDLRRYVFDAPIDRLRVEFNNDATPPDRNVFIEYVDVVDDGVEAQTFVPDDINVLSAGTWVPEADECVSGMGLGPWIHCNGYKDFTGAYAARIANVEPPTPETPTGCTLDDVKSVLVELGPCEAMQLMLEAFGWEQS